MNTKQTSETVASLASKILQNPKSTALEKRLAGSALSQTGTLKQTGKELETLASEVLKDPKSGEHAKTLAASVVAQANKAR